MEFQLQPDIAHLFAGAAAAFMRTHADSVWLNKKGDLWNELWTSFRDADTASVTVSFEAGRLMMNVWGTKHVWRDEQTRESVKAQLRPQWIQQMRAGLAPRGGMIL
ncbi:hypothetical protein ABZ916_25830 [Streptomyces sp. NPDC046853]|uniref:hypothetical protein n=1 Tax=Streptomyces sp. NPDC046853 TaxID=3154920 RepID=UPI0033DD7D29